MFECFKCWGFGGPRGQHARQRKRSPTTSCCRPLGASSRAASRSSWDGSGRSMVPSRRAKSPSYPRSAAWIRDGLRSRGEWLEEPLALNGCRSGTKSYRGRRARRESDQRTIEASCDTPGNAVFLDTFGCSLRAMRALWADGCKRDRAERSARAQGLSRSLIDSSRGARAEQHRSTFARRTVGS